jgi:hypothetical protein
MGVSPARQKNGQSLFPTEDGGLIPNNGQLNGVDPQARLAHVLAKLPDHPAKRIDESLPWNWKANQQTIAKAA